MAFIKNNKKMFIIMTAFILVVVVFLSLTLVKDDAIAKFDGESISKEELYDEMVELYGAATVDQIIADKIVVAEAKKQKITISTKEIDKELDQLKESYGGEDAFNQMLESNNTTLAALKDDITNYLTLRKLLEKEIEISDEDLQTYFDENKDSLGEAEQVKASHILVEDENKAKEIKAKLDAGEDFAELAKEFSTDESTKESGGELGYFEKGTMVAEFDEVAFTLPVNQISDPVKSEYGYHIIKVEDKKEAKEANFEDSKDKMKETLLEEKMETEYPTWLEEKKKDYDIENSFETVTG
ncbi:peptidylprolyl isomerase [Neobacillus sp. K501]